MAVTSLLSDPIDGTLYLERGVSCVKTRLNNERIAEMKEISAKAEAEGAVERAANLRKIKVADMTVDEIINAILARLKEGV